MVQKIKQDISLGSNIRLLRKQSHLTQEQVVARLQLQGIDVKNSMSCHSSALTRCHKLTHLSVTTSGAFAPDFLLYSSNHFMVSYKPHHMLIYQAFLLLICVHQCFLTDPIDHPWYPH